MLCAKSMISPTISNRRWLVKSLDGFDMELPNMDPHVYHGIGCENRNTKQFSRQICGDLSIWRCIWGPPQAYLETYSYAFPSQKGNSRTMGMISPTISLCKNTSIEIIWLYMHTASPLTSLLYPESYSYFKIGYFSRNSISNFQKFLKKFQNRTFLKFVPSKHFLITFLVNVQSTWKFIFR